MPGGRAFLDSNIPLYLIGSDLTKAAVADGLILAGGTISLQVLAEVATVARRKHALSWDEIEDVLGVLREVCDVVELTSRMFSHAVELARQTGYALDDCQIIAAALASGCDVLYSEDMQDGHEIDGVLTIRNPFKI
ncbi:MAG: PIN domain-containing protein [Caulobacteraceae bacterium]|nr:MAG: PIN domain-containing protein [Caulobacteraceae bacterium]